MVPLHLRLTDNFSAIPVISYELSTFIRNTTLVEAELTEQVFILKFLVVRKTEEGFPYRCFSKHKVKNLKSSPSWLSQKHDTRTTA